MLCFSWAAKQVALFLTSIEASFKLAPKLKNIVSHAECIISCIVDPIVVQFQNFENSLSIIIDSAYIMILGLL